MRSASDEQNILGLFRQRLCERPRAGFVVATVEVAADGNSVGVQASEVACGPLELVTVADELLRQAAERMRGMPDASSFAGLIAAIEGAKATLALSRPEAVH